MPEEPEVPTPPKKRNERTEAKFLEDADKVIAEAVRLGAAYDAPNPIASFANLKAKRDGVLAQRTVNQANNAAEETVRNTRENLFKPLQKDVRSLVDYAKSSGKPQNDLAALNTIARELAGRRAGQKGEGSISVSQLSYVSRTDNYSRFIEQYDSLGIATGEDFYKAATHRTKLTAMRQSTTDVINAVSNSSTSGELLDRLAYLDNDSLLNSCISAKNYIKSKYKNAEPYRNIAKTRFDMPSRLR